jgi:hypothetical protein
VACRLNEVRAILAASPNFPFALVNQALDGAARSDAAACGHGPADLLVPAVPEVQGTTADVARAKCAAAAAQVRSGRRRQAEA